MSERDEVREREGGEGEGASEEGARRERGRRSEDEEVRGEVQIDARGRVYIVLDGPIDWPTRARRGE